MLKTLYVGFLIWVSLGSWIIIIWSIVDYIRIKRSEKKRMEYWNKRQDERLREFYGWKSEEDEEEE